MIYIYLFKLSLMESTTLTSYSMKHQGLYVEKPGTRKKILAGSVLRGCKSPNQNPRETGRGGRGRERALTLWKRSKDLYSLTQVLRGTSVSLPAARVLILRSRLVSKIHESRDLGRIAHCPKHINTWRRFIYFRISFLSQNDFVF